MEVEALTDEALCERARGGDVAATEQLIHRCRGLILRACRPYFLTGGDYEDLMQEGMIGLFKEHPVLQRQKPLSRALPISVSARQYLLRDPLCDAGQEQAPQQQQVLSWAGAVRGS